ncbi:hypothetical protein [Facklamia miroungae]|uniref:Uncharacterized protein n=1 Tax=Facklamia miroungae TaxID=120956 RepID=A0A1G7QCN3_9LACT|nr:hypothetical protein [Facklamia miroungae]NKZ28901.1 hypothetical protein [Facklamia miroungae]SDF96276.1 hypothetical protein SAMN05421791_10250 [Facklamia miroungae]
MEKILNYIGVHTTSTHTEQRVNKNAGHILGLCIAFIPLGILTIISFKQELNLYPISTLIEGYLIGTFGYRAFKYFQRTSLLASLPYIVFIVFLIYLFMLHFQNAINF